MTLTIDGPGTLTTNDKLTVSGETTLNISAVVSGTVDLLDGAILKDSTINGGVFVAGKVIFRGDNTVNMVKLLNGILQLTVKNFAVGNNNNRSEDLLVKIIVKS